MFLLRNAFPVGSPAIRFFEIVIQNERCGAELYQRGEQCQQAKELEYEAPIGALSFIHDFYP